MLASEPWTIDSITVERHGDTCTVEMNGWAFPDPVLGQASHGNFLINGRPFAKIDYPIDRSEIGPIFWQRPNARYSGFRCVARGKYDEIYRNGILEVSYVNPGPPRRVPAQQSWFLCDVAREGPFPDEDRRFRVIGNKGLTGFVLTGLTDFKRLDAAVENLTGKGFAGYSRVLDWGCGCGRVARFATRVNGIAFTGCDIDADNVAWCTENLAGRFVCTTLLPPLPFGETSFDLVYGVSIFTHLREPLQDAWLSELQRVTAPGGILLMTVHARTALDYAGISAEDYRTLEGRIREQGLYVSSSNSQIDGYADHDGEYVNVFHDINYLQDRWSRYFEIVAVLPGYIYTHDLVVMRRRG